MTVYNITHAYLIGESDVFIDTHLPKTMIEDAIALICFTLEEQVSDSSCAYEKFLVTCLEEILPNKVKNCSSVGDCDVIDQHWARETRCGAFYKTNWLKWKSTDQYKIVCKLISENKDMYEE